MFKALIKKVKFKIIFKSNNSINIVQKSPSKTNSINNSKIIALKKLNKTIKKNKVQVNKQIVFISKIKIVFFQITIKNHFQLIL